LKWAMGERVREQRAQKISLIEPAQKQA
jgi:hypothetical protein